MVQPAHDGGLSGKMTADFYTADAPARRYTTTSSAVRASPQRTVPATESRGVFIPAGCQGDGALARGLQYSWGRGSFIPSPCEGR